LDAAALRQLWPEVLDVVKKSSRRARALLDNAQLVEATAGSLTLEAPEKLARMISEDSNTSVLRSALSSVIGGSWEVEVRAAGTGRQTPSARSTGSGPADPSTDPAPPQVDPRDDTDPDDPPQPGERPDAESEALRLLQDQLGARPVADELGQSGK
jgi:DNA polymerase-3 subunit gamma/tau